mgnify:CR=1 FL=1
MAKVRRFSGHLKIELSYNDRTDQYQVRLCPVKVPLYRGKMQPHARCEKGTVRPPRHLERAVDSPLAFDQAARAALSFASPRIQEFAFMGPTTWAIKRDKPRRYVKGHPKAKRR